MGSTSPPRHPVCAARRCAAILPQINREKDVSILAGNRDRTLRVAHSRAPLRPALCALRSDDTEAIWTEAPERAWPGLDSGPFYSFVTFDL
jgi:hypothetical protein